MKYAIAHTADQTWVYFSEEPTELGQVQSTTSHAQAFLWLDLNDASLAMARVVAAHAVHLKNGGNVGIEHSDNDIVGICGEYWIEPVLSEAEFRAREDTW